jgi:hypothetical protein
MTIYYIMDVVLYLWYCCVIFLLLSLNPIVLVKSSVAVFSLREESDFPEVMSQRDMAEMVHRGVNY